MNSTVKLPYELHTHGSGAFVSFKITEQIALPLLTLARATLRAEREKEELVLEFQGVQVAISGHGLAEMLDHLLCGRVKKICCADNGGCAITAIQFTESPCI